MTGKETENCSFVRLDKMHRQKINDKKQGHATQPTTNLVDQDLR
jgi:hypothetical protein